MPKKTPLQFVKDRFGDKAKLVAEVQKFVTDDLWVNRTSAAKGLEHVSNAKLLRLHAIFTEVKEKYGTRAKLIDAILSEVKRPKDLGYRALLEKHPVPRLLDQLKSALKRNRAAAPAKVEAPAKKPAKAAAKPVAKKVPAKKKPAAK